MLCPVISLEDWCEQHDLKPIERKCRNCDLILRTTIPVVTKKSRGLKSPTHDCGPEYDLVMLKPIDKQLIDLMNSF